ncbi:MAG: hypothetical protein WDN09_03385 [bacterium]
MNLLGLSEATLKALHDIAGTACFIGMILFALWIRAWKRRYGRDRAAMEKNPAGEPPAQS